MIFTIKHITSKAVITRFAKEIHKTHLAYLTDYKAAYQRAKKLLTELDHQGFPTLSVVPFPKIQEEGLVKLNPNTRIELTYKATLLSGSALTWVKLN